MTKNLKKKIGEDLYKFLTLNFSCDLLSEELPKYFGQISDLKFLGKDDYQKLKNFLNQKLNQEKKEEKEIPKKTAKELLNEVGYVLDDKIKEKKDYLKYKKYYKGGEELCKFNGYDACNRYYKVFWIYKKNIDEIKRENFKNPKRQDEYGVSCCSIAISKDKKNVAQICNRYNHIVKAPDNTFSSNLENIIEGLTEAFNKDYNLEIGLSNSVEFDNFYENNGKFFYYYQEINGKKYGNNTIDGKIYNPDQYIIFDNFILDLKNKTIRTGCGANDSFVDIVNQKLKNGAKIEIRKGDIPEDLIDDEKKIIIFK